MDFTQIGKWIILMGMGLAAVGALLWVIGKTGLPLGSLPGDIRVDRPGLSLWFPLATCILLSVMLTIAANLVLWFLRR
jgi:uncharacterized membrane protein YbhN (UPF0104 family)